MTSRKPASLVDEDDSLIPASFHAAVNKALISCDAKHTESRDSRQHTSEVDVFELARDLGTVLHSQCTKLAIAAKPPRNGEVVTTLIREIEKLLPMFESLCRFVRPSIHGVAVVQFICKQCKYALLGLQSLIEATCLTEYSEARLSRTAILWESCIALQTMTPLHTLVSAKVAESLQMIGDAIDDLESWQAGESDLNLEDDFATSDNGSEDESAVDASPVLPVNSKAASESDTQRRVAMIKRIQLLLRAVDKRRVSKKDITVSELNDIFSTSALLAVDIDDWAVEIQEEAGQAFIVEFEKTVVLRVEELLDQVTRDGSDEKWLAWSKNFRSRWLEEVVVPTASKTIRHYRLVPAYRTFWTEHARPLVPCIIDGLLKSWQSTKCWRRSLQEASYEPDYQYLRGEFGSLPVSVTKSPAQAPETMTFGEFLYGMEFGYSWYARDIHLAREFPHHDIYSCPPIFLDDWLNFKLTSENLDDYKFVYIGGNATRTKLHKDVVASHSWSTNLTGCKVWTLIPPAYAQDLFSFDGDEVISDVFLEDQVTAARWPNLQRARDHAIKVTQHPGETIFVPSTWYHQVENKGPTLSINHNWINAASLMAIFNNLTQEMILSAEAIVDLKEDGIVDDAGFVDVVQDLTLANAGMNWETFFELILYRFDNEARYIAPELRPDAREERSLVLQVCELWIKLPDAEHLSKVSEIVGKIVGHCDIKR